MELVKRISPDARFPEIAQNANRRQSHDVDICRAVFTIVLATTGLPEQLTRLGEAWHGLLSMLERP